LRKTLINTRNGRTKSILTESITPEPLKEKKI
jgi:hypothetical protein